MLPFSHLSIVMFTTLHDGVGVGVNPSRRLLCHFRARDVFEDVLSGGEAALPPRLELVVLEGCVKLGLIANSVHVVGVHLGPSHRQLELDERVERGSERLARECAVGVRVGVEAVERPPHLGM